MNPRWIAKIAAPPVSLSLLIIACGSGTPPAAPPAPVAAERPAPPAHPDEVHLADVRQLTYGTGENAEAYWSFDGTELIFQSKRDPHQCDHIYRVPADGSAPPTLVSSGQGRTTCAYFFPGDERILYSSTHLAGPECPPVPDHSQGYVWPIYDSYEIFSAARDGSDLRQLTDNQVYDAEATVCGKDGSILFTSTRDGDLDLYRMDADGSNVVRLTDTPGYDGGAFFSQDCSKIVWRASRPQGEALEEYRRLLGQGLVRPGKLEIYVADADGANARQVTYLDAASFAPYFHPSGRRILFSTNYGDPRGREFDIWAIDIDGTNLERITHTEGFDGFPMFSPDGTWLAFGSNRNQQEPGQTDVYVARWVEGDGARPVSQRPADRFKADVAWLADPAREGRGIGTAGLAAAADWLEERFGELGLEPGYGGSFRQPLEVLVDVARGAATTIHIAGKPVPAEQFVPSGYSANGKVTARTVSAGYGISWPERGYDDYKGLSVKGKIVVVRRFVPEDKKAFADDEAKRRYGDLHYKAWNARQRGAVGLIVVDTASEEAPLPPLRVERHGDAGMPVVILRHAAAAPLLRTSQRVTLNVALEPVQQPAHNLVGVIRAGAADKLPGAVIIGAHYDHLGHGGEGSLEPDSTVPHVGADDNASGVAALLEVARALAKERQALRRDVYLIAFSAEETGILGSTAFVRTPPEGLDPKQIVAMLNMDMVGRLRDNTLAVLGGESAAEWPELLAPLCARALVRCAIGGDGYGPSDHTPFYAAGAPVLHFFTGAHEQYHKPTDTADRINAEGGVRVAMIVAGLATVLAGRDQPLTYREAEAPTRAGDTRSYGASLGTIPDYSGAADDQPGILLTGVRKGSPADQAGLRRGDRIIKMGTHTVANIRDMMQVLRAAKPGDTTTITVLRDGKQVEVQVTYGESARR